MKHWRLMKIKLGCCSNKNSSCGTTLDVVHGAHDRPQGGGNNVGGKAMPNPNQFNISSQDDSTNSSIGGLSVMACVDPLDPMYVLYRKFLKLHSQPLVIHHHLTN
jgi:hypothetical protein